MGFCLCWFGGWEGLYKLVPVHFFIWALQKSYALGIVQPCRTERGTGLWVLKHPGHRSSKCQTCIQIWVFWFHIHPVFLRSPNKYQSPRGRVTSERNSRPRLRKPLLFKSLPLTLFFGPVTFRNFSICKLGVSVSSGCYNKNSMDWAAYTIYIPFSQSGGWALRSRCWSM